MIAFIIFGTRGVTTTKEKGDFHCPQCGPGSSFKHKNVRRFFTLYFIPVIPLDKLGEYVECGQCKGTFHADILGYSPESDGTQVQALFMVAMKQVMIAMLLADGVIDDDEVKELQVTFEDLSGETISEQELREEIDLIQRTGSSAIELVQAIAPGLNDQGKEMVITAAYQIAIADGNFDPSEQMLIDAIAGAMEISATHLKGIMSDLTAPRIASE